MSQPNDPFESEPICLLMGTGDGGTSTFETVVRGPIIPGSVCVRVLHVDVVERLAKVSDPGFCAASAVDLTKDGVLHGHCYSGGTVNYRTGLVTVNWSTVPEVNAPVEIIYRREIHVLHGGDIRVRGKDGKKHWISFDELNRVLGLA